jgi:hypothetical protein
MITEYTVLPLENAIQIKSVDDVSGAAHYKIYTQDQKADFLAEVDGAESYALAMGW